MEIWRIIKFNKSTNQQINNFKKMATIKIKQTKSGINRPERQKRTLRALGFTKMNQVLDKEATPQIMGMLKKVEHLVTVIK